MKDRVDWVFPGRIYGHTKPFVGWSEQFFVSESDYLIQKNAKKFRIFFHKNINSERDHILSMIKKTPFLKPGKKPGPDQGILGSETFSLFRRVFGGGSKVDKSIVGFIPC